MKFYYTIVFSIVIFFISHGQQPANANNPWIEMPETQSFWDTIHTLNIKDTLAQDYLLKHLGADLLHDYGVDFPCYSIIIEDVEALSIDRIEKFFDLGHEHPMLLCSLLQLKHPNKKSGVEYFTALKTKYTFSEEMIHWIDDIIIDYERME